MLNGNSMESYIETMYASVFLLGTYYMVDSIQYKPIEISVCSINQ